MALAKDIRNELNSIKNELSTNNAINAAQHATAATERQFLRRDVDKLEVVKAHIEDLRILENRHNESVKEHADYLREQKLEKSAQKAFIFKVAALAASTVTTLLIGVGSLLVKLYEWFGPSASSPIDLTSQ